MVLPRLAVLRTPLKSSGTRALRLVKRSQPWQYTGRRGYAHEGHAPKKAASDLPWLVGAVVVTVPVCAYLLQPSPDKGHGHGHGHDEHASEGHDEDGEHGEAKDDESESGDKETSDDVTDAKGSGDDDDTPQDTPDTSEDGDAPGQRDGQQSGEGSTKDTPAPSKPALGPNQQSGKQEGITNSDTKHSVKLDDSERSKKGDGQTDTAKSKGTVNPKRPQA